MFSSWERNVSVNWGTRKFCSCLLPHVQNCGKKTVCSSSFRMGLAISLVSDVKEKVQYVRCSSNCIMFKLKRKKSDDAKVVLSNHYVTLTPNLLLFNLCLH